MPGRDTTELDEHDATDTDPVGVAGHDADTRAALIETLRSDSPAHVDPTRPAEYPVTARDRTRLHRASVVITLVAALIGVALLGLLLGSIKVDASDVWSVLLHRIGGDWLVTPAWSRTTDLVIADVRLPRVLLAGIVGAALAVAGMVIQALVRNPLAGPGVLGVSTGAATGAVTVLRFGALAGVASLHVAAFAGALLTLFVVFWIARTRTAVTAARLVLTGMAVSAVLSALTSLLVLTSPDPTLASQVLFWTLGGFGSAEWNLLLLPAVALFAGVAIALTQARNLNLLLSGEESAASLGLDVRRFRQWMFLVTAVMIGAAVAVSGVISFVGLMLPHAVRLLVGADHRRALPVCALLGAVFMIGADLVARSVLSPEELPVGIVTALVGGPAFVWMLRRNGRGTGVR